MVKWLGQLAKMAESRKQTARAHKSGRLPLILPPAGASRHTGTVIFIHGACDTGSGLSEWVAHRIGRPFAFGHVKVVLPTAPMRFYTPAGANCSVWFDFPDNIRYDDVREDIAGLESSRAEITDLIRSEISDGIAENRIIVGGLSQGGILALHAGLECDDVKLAGVFVLSSYLPDRSALLDRLSRRPAADLARVPVYMAHGDRDQLIPAEWGRLTQRRLADLGIPTTFRTYSGLAHDLCSDELLDLQTWILGRLPP